MLAAVAAIRAAPLTYPQVSFGAGTGTGAAQLVTARGRRAFYRLEQGGGKDRPLVRAWISDVSIQLQSS